MVEETQGSMDPHRNQPIEQAGANLKDAPAAMIMVHGRGATAQSILGLRSQLERPRLSLLAPQAARRTWYPHSFLAPIEANQPYLDSALRRLSDTVKEVRDAGITKDRLLLLGFSQGACLTLEFAARNPDRYGGIIAFTGGLIGPEGTQRDYDGNFEGTPVFIGSSNPDPHVPVSRVEETAQILESLGAKVTSELYPGMAHTVNQDEIRHAQIIIDDVLN